MHSKRLWVVIAALAAGIVIAIVAGPSVAAQTGGGSGYGAPQVLGEQFINPKSTGSSNVGFWIGLAFGVALLGSTGFIGWRRTHPHPVD